MDATLSAQIAVVMAVLLGGLCVHQVTLNFDSMRSRTDAFKEAVKETGANHLWPVRIVIYAVLPLVFLVLLEKAGIPNLWVLLYCFKLLLTSILSSSAERHFAKGGDYSRGWHILGQTDAALNLTMAITVAWQLVMLFRVPMP